jgi:hypothetical protein
MNTLVDALASRFMRRRLERNGTAGKFLAVSGRLAVQTAPYPCGDDDTGRGAFLQNCRLTVRDIGQDASRNDGLTRRFALSDPAPPILSGQSVGIVTRIQVKVHCNEGLPQETLRKWTRLL